MEDHQIGYVEVYLTPGSGINGNSHTLRRIAMLIGITGFANLFCKPDKRNPYGAGIDV